MSEEKSSGTRTDSNDTPKRIVLRHLSGSKANQVEAFSLKEFKEISIGRDPAMIVKYDPNKDDLVSRKHARIEPDPGNAAQFFLVDLGSNNGTFVNKQRITGKVSISPGDLVQLGAGGPEFQFDLEPRPAGGPRATRIGGVDLSGVLPTRVGENAATSPSFPQPTLGMPTATVGKATVERMIERSRSQTHKYMFIGGAALLAIIVLGLGTFTYFKLTENTVSSAKKTMTPQEIVQTHGSAVVYIEVNWKLINTRDGGQVYHTYMPNLNSKTGRPLIANAPEKLAVYVRLPDGSYEPLPNFDEVGEPLLGSGTGTGFAVTSDGFILTTRHIATPWRSRYNFPDDAIGIAVDLRTFITTSNIEPELDENNEVKVIRPLENWIPAESKLMAFTPWRFHGQNDRLDVTFAKNDLRFPAKVARVSDRHDVAMLKIDTPESVPMVQLNDNYDTIQPGDPAIVLGFPGIAPNVYRRTISEDALNRQSTVKTVPDPTVSVGNIGRITRSQEGNEIYSEMGDVYQLATPSAGAGNSGGPVFDDQGKVIAIFFAGITTSENNITFAVPIRYGKELMGTKKVVQ